MFSVHMNMATEPNLLDSFEWIGQFWRAGHDTEPFPGVVKYSPRDGLMLMVVRKGMSEALAEEPLTVHGYTQEAGEITLLGVLSTGRTVRSFITMKEAFFCKSAILGGIWADDHPWKGCSFCTNRLDDFCRPRAAAGCDEFTTAPVATSDLGDITLSLRKTATGTFIGGGISSLLLLDETQAEFKSELDALALDLAGKHGVTNYTAKSRIGYEWHLETQAESVSFETLLEHVYAVCDLLSVLMLHPVKPTQMSLLAPGGMGEERPREQFPVALSMWLTDKEKLALGSDVHFQLLPVNLSCIRDFESMGRKWRAFARDELNLVYSSVLSHIRGERGIPHTILLISAIEQWTAKYSSAPQGASKYDWALEEYCNDPMKQRLAEVIPLERRAGETLGALLSRVRGAVLHPGTARGSRAKSAVLLVNRGTLVNVGEILFAVLVIAIYRMLGVDQGSVHNIQKYIDRHIAIYHEY